ncbi:hypothetical protein DQ04_01771040 [Trypanosoma grayi]|uniref:hypothetical protein n=1 Tax=Trypanosoma grayi TaxID=71804 RepID=UPI0004F41B2E|nr:hypothetical protein DQ04_01771040 [Trypanosoma grayi]KEG12356.1 hypothetical protein DQ04_01771040 [Trypanosoma grayi]
MKSLDDAAVDALIREDEKRLQQSELLDHSEAERRRLYYGAVELPKQPEKPPPPPRARLTGTTIDTLSDDIEESLVREYKRQRHGDNDAEADLRRDGPPPPNYDGPFLTLTERGPYTRFEVLAQRPPMRPHVGGKAVEKPRSRHYPRPLDNASKKTCNSGPGDSLRRWKYTMGLTNE